MRVQLNPAGQFPEFWESCWVAHSSCFLRSFSGSTSILVCRDAISLSSLVTRVEPCLPLVLPGGSLVDECVDEDWWEDWCAIDGWAREDEESRFWSVVWLSVNFPHAGAAVGAWYEVLDFVPDELVAWSRSSLVPGRLGPSRWSVVPWLEGSGRLLPSRWSVVPWLEGSGRLLQGLLILLDIGTAST